MTRVTRVAKVTRATRTMWVTRATRTMWVTRKTRMTRGGFQHHTWNACVIRIPNI